MTPALDLSWFTEDGFVVTGTQDAHVALAFATTIEDIDCRIEAIDLAQRNDCCEPDPEDARQLGDWCHEQIAIAKPGRWRWFEIPEDEREPDGATQYLVRAEESDDVFDGVMFL